MTTDEVCQEDGDEDGRRLEGEFLLKGTKSSIKREKKRAEKEDKEKGRWEGRRVWLVIGLQSGSPRGLGKWPGQIAPRLREYLYIWSDRVFACPLRSCCLAPVHTQSVHLYSGYEWQSFFAKVGKISLRWIRCFELIFQRVWI